MIEKKAPLECFGGTQGGQGLGSKHKWSVYPHFNSEPKGGNNAKSNYHNVVCVSSDFLFFYLPSPGYPVDCSRVDQPSQKSSADSDAWRTAPTFIRRILTKSEALQGARHH